MAELAEQEAERVEAEDAAEGSVPEPETASPGEHPAADEATGPGAEQSLEAQFAAFERENERHERELRAIMGDDFEAFQACPGCSGVGYAPVTGVQYDPQLERCQRCQGHGVMLTGSVHEHHAIRDCLACAGTGYVTKVEAPAPPQPAIVTGQPMFDPYTGQPIVQLQPPAAQSDQPWAPGYVPPSRPASSPLP